MKTVIMAGGKGSRIAELYPDIPKSLIPIQGLDGTSRPVLEWEIESLRSQGFREIILTVGYRAGQIQEHFGDGSALGVNISYFVEEMPLGNAGALFKLKDELTEDFLLLNADAVFDVDFQRMVRWHREKGALATIFTHPNSHPYDSGLVATDDSGAVVSWLTKEEIRPRWYKNRVNAGLHVISPALLDMAAARIAVDKIGTEACGKMIKVDLDRQILKPLCGTKKMFAYDSPEYVKDMGTPERYHAVCRDFKEDRVHGRNLRNRQKAIFLDRDGTINKYVGFLRNVDDFELVNGVAEAIRKVNESGYLAIVVTNQPVVARGEVSFQELETIHNKMETLLGQTGAYLDAIYYCPHHPHGGYEGEVKELKVDCGCRKPKPGMLLSAADDFNIDLKASWMIGDGENDVKAGKAAGCRTVFISEGDKNQAGADAVVKNLLEGVEHILVQSSWQCRHDKDKEMSWKA